MLTYEERRSLIGPWLRFDSVDDNGMNHDKLGKFAAKSGDRHPVFKPDAGEAEAYRKQFDRVVESKVSLPPPLKIGRTPKVFRELGVPDLDMSIRRDVIRKASNGVKDNHDIPLEALRYLPEELADPVAVFDSKTETDSLVVLLELKTRRNKLQAMAAVHINKNTQNVQVNDVSSIYGRPDYQYQAWVNEGLLRYASNRFSKNGKPRSGTTGGAAIAPCCSPNQGSTKRKVLTEADIVKEHENGN